MKKRVSVRCGIGFGLAALVLLVAGLAPAMDVRLAWSPPTHNIDGTPLTDLAGYKLYYGTASGQYSHCEDLGMLTNALITGLSEYQSTYFTVTVYNSLGVESDFSEEVIQHATTINLLLSSHGGVLDSFTTAYPGFPATKLTDESASSFWWSQPYPTLETFEYSFCSGGVARVEDAVLCNNRADFAARDFAIWASLDGETYDLVTIGVLSANKGDQVFDLGGALAKSLRLQILSGYSSVFWELGEFKVFGALVDMPPACVIRRDDASPTHADTLNFSLNFTEPVTGFDMSDLTLIRDGGVNGTLQNFAGSDSRYTVQLAGVSGDGAIGLAIRAGVCIDASGKTNSAAEPVQYDVDNTAPAAGSITSVTNMGLLRLAYSGAADDGSGLKAVALWVRKDAGAWQPSGLTAAAGSGSFDYAPSDGSGTYSFALRAEDNAGNLSAPITGNGDRGVFCPEIVNLVLPQNGGLLETFTSQYPGFDALRLTDDNPSTHWWSTAYPQAQTFEYTFESNRTARLIEFALYNRCPSFAVKTFEIWTSTDDIHFELAACGTLDPGAGAQRFSANGAIATRVRLVLTGAYSPVFWELAEFEVIGYLVDLPPECRIDRDAPNPTNRETLDFTVRFTEPVVGFTLDDVRLSLDGVSGALAGFSGSGSTYSVTVEGVHGNGTVGIMVPSNTCTDLAGKTNETDSALVCYTVDQTAPAAGHVTGTTNISPVTVQYAGASDVGVGLRAVHLWVKKEMWGEWKDTALTAAGESGAFDFVPRDGSGMYYFAVRAEDKAGNWSAPVDGNGDLGVFCPEIINLVLPEKGGVLESFTSQYPGFEAWKLTDTDASSFWWSAAYPVLETFEYSFESNYMARITEIVLYNNRAAFATTGFELWTTTDGDTWELQMTGALHDGPGPQRFPAGEFTARAIRLVLTDGRNISFRELGEFEVMGYFVDLPPDCTVTRTHANPNNGTEVGFSIVFSEPVIGFDQSDIVLQGDGVGGSIAAFAGAGSVYSVLIDGLSGTGTIGICIPSNSCTDLAGKTNINAATADYTIDHAAPTPGHVTGAEGMSPVRIAYDGASDVGSGLDAVTLWYRKGSGGVWVSSGLSEFGANGVFDFLPPDGAGTYYFAVRARDRAGNLSAPIAGDGDLSMRCEDIVNLVLPVYGGTLEAFTSQYPSMEAAKLTDEIVNSKQSVWWSAAYPQAQTFEYAFNGGQAARACQVVLHNYSTAFSCRDFEVWASVDEVNYSLVLTGSLRAGSGPQLFDLGDVPAKRLRIVITGGYNGSFWELAEIEVYGYLSWPHAWTSGDWSADYASYYLTDGNTNTVWVGNADGCPWTINVDLGEGKRLQDFTLLYDGALPQNVAMLGSRDGIEWFDMAAAQWPVDARYVHVNMWADAPSDPPAIREIIWAE
jgi:hypothetical protein